MKICRRRLASPRPRAVAGAQASRRRIGNGTSPDELGEAGRILAPDAPTRTKAVVSCAVAAQFARCDDSRRAPMAYREGINDPAGDQGIIVQAAPTLGYLGSWCRANVYS